MKGPWVKEVRGTECASPCWMVFLVRRVTIRQFQAKNSYHLAYILTDLAWTLIFIYGLSIHMKGLVRIMGKQQGAP